MFNCCCFSYPKVIHSVGFFTRMINPQSQPLNFVFWLIASSLLVLGFSTNQKTPARYSTSPSFMVVAFSWFLYCTGWFVLPCQKVQVVVDHAVNPSPNWLRFYAPGLQSIQIMLNIWLAPRKPSDWQTRKDMFCLAFQKFCKLSPTWNPGVQEIGTQGRQKSWDPDGPDVIPGCVAIW